MTTKSSNSTRTQALERRQAAELRAGTDLLTLRAQLHRAEKEARRAPAPPPARPKSQTPKAQQAVKPQRAQELAGVDTDDFLLSRALRQLRDAVYDSRYHVCPHAVQHARAEGFMESDIMDVLLTGRVRAVYPEDHRWLVCGYFEAHGIRLPLHVAVQHYRDGHIDIVTAFVPKNPHHIISRARLALLVRYDDEQVRSKEAVKGNKVGYKGKGGWK
ncbi:DUF4258 domain-containing protein [Deinococcus radiodurans]|uniref:DUF4258 domain-containing protein n=1 Tax=Deinococcus radiodurans TaxID=1299 RepID=UPI0003002D24|nr:DUF4258 domain-containing protein [Deinococcus radiodurans]UID69222.1 hypothetical protein DRO_0214 [Deinococcus radiodurans R1 = ATCC 13939 = DSM 20539]